MLARWKRCWSRSAIAVAAALLFMAAPGCQLFDRLRGEGFKEETPESTKWRRGLRPESNPNDFGGLSNKAREIESHLGS